MSIIRNIFSTFLLIILSTSLVFAVSEPDYNIERPVFSGGGGKLTGSQFQMRTVVVGQNMTAMKLSNNTYTTDANSGYVLMLAPNNPPVFNTDEEFYITADMIVNPYAQDGVTIGGIINQMSDAITDLDNDTEFGIALTNISNAYGQWQYSTDNGSSWTDIYSVSEDNALLLADDSDTRLRFVPTSGYMGEYPPGDLIFRIWDQYRGESGDYVNVNESSWADTLSQNFSVIIGDFVPLLTAVPTLTEWGQLIFFLILVYMSFRVMNRQRVRARK